jgi:hypothetical protein
MTSNPVLHAPTTITVPIEDSSIQEDFFTLEE